MIGLLAREVFNLSSGIGPHLQELLQQNPDWTILRRSLIFIISIIFSEGSIWAAVTFFVILLLLIGLKHSELQNQRNNGLIESLNSRITELGEEKSGVQIKMDRQAKKYRKDQNKILDSLKARGISTSKIVEKYNKPLLAIIGSYASQKVESKSGSYISKPFIRDKLLRFNSKGLGGSDFIIPPINVPNYVIDKESLKYWFEKEILKGRYAKIKFLSLIDLNKSTYWNTYLPYAQKTPRHFTISEALTIDDLFSENQINQIAIADIIKEGDILWLTASFLTTQEQSVLQANQISIEKAIGDPNVKQLATGNFENQISKQLKGLVNNSDAVAQKITKEAIYWNKKLNLF